MTVPEDFGNGAVIISLMCTQALKRFSEFSISLPDWLHGEIPPRDHVYQTVEERMNLAIRLAEINVTQGTGGPFGAAIFDLETATLVSPGVNVVIPSHCSLAHAELVAIALAQQIFQTHDLGASGMPPTQLVTSTEPCAMCLGAIPWSGVSSVVCGARDEDARAVGFDEGPKPSDWASTLTERGIEVIRDIGRQRVIQILQKYVSAGGLIYNGRSADPSGKA